MSRYVWVAAAMTILGGCQTPMPRSEPPRNGLSIDQAVVMTGGDAEGVDGEYVWLRNHVPGSKVTQQELLIHGRRKIDKLDVELPDGSSKAYYFDITETFGNF